MLLLLRVFLFRFKISGLNFTLLVISVTRVVIFNANHKLSRYYNISSGRYIYYGFVRLRLDNEYDCEKKTEEKAA